MKKVKKILEPETALLIVDMQNYYLNKNSSYYKYFESLQPGCLDYIYNRCHTLVIPNISQLITCCRKSHVLLVYLRLCGTEKDRNDLHRFFRETNNRAAQKGFDNVYPLNSDWMADIVDPLKPLKNDVIIDKTTYSPFTYTSIDLKLKEYNISTVIMCGLATSQCVETTARDASDRGYKVIHIEDAEADYDESSHIYSLHCSKGVCGDLILNTDELLHNIPEH